MAVKGPERWSTGLALPKGVSGAAAAVGGLFSMGVDAVKFVFVRPFQWREFLEQSWFVARVSLAPQPGRYRLDVKSTEADGPLTSVQFDVGWYSDGNADTPDLLETSIDKPEYQSGDTMVVSVNARSAGRLTINVLGDRLLTTQSINVK